MTPKKEEELREIKRIDKSYSKKLDKLCEKGLGRSKEARKIKREWIEEIRKFTPKKDNHSPKEQTGAPETTPQTSFAPADTSFSEKIKEVETKFNSYVKDTEGFLKWLTKECSKIGVDNYYNIFKEFRKLKRRCENYKENTYVLLKDKKRFETRWRRDYNKLKLLREKKSKMISPSQFNFEVKKLMDEIEKLNKELGR